jgi:hypothetical protein
MPISRRKYKLRLRIVIFTCPEMKTNYNLYYINGWWKCLIFCYLETHSDEQDIISSLWGVMNHPQNYLETS